MRTALALSVVFAVAFVPTSLARAEILGMARGDSIAVQAENLDIDILSGEATLTGNVTLVKGDLTVACPRIDLRFDRAPHVTWARGSGGVTADVRGVHAEAPSVELDLTRQLLSLAGGVRLTHGQGWLTADSARIEIATVKVTLSQVKGSLPVVKAP